MLKTYRNESSEGIRKGDTVTDKGFGREFIAESSAIWDESLMAFVVLSGYRWLEVSPTVDITCEEIDELEYA